MIHPLLQLIATQPQLLVEHVVAYVELAGDGLGKSASALKWRMVLSVVALVCVVIASILGGVALMLWAVIPPEDIHAPWALLAAPLLPLVVAALCLVNARYRAQHAGFADLKEQFDADLVMLREVSAR